MFEPTSSLTLHRLSRQNLKRYESDEEDVSESDAGGPDLVPSLVGSQRAGTIDSDLSADENSHLDPDSDREDHLLAPCHVAKRPRPVSMDTVKRSSDATFGENARVFDPEEDMLEIPLPESPPELASDLYLQPAIYVSPNTPPTTHHRSRSPSPSSIFSVENAEIHVAKKITLMEPPTRPTLVFINSLGNRSKSRLRPTQPRVRGTTRNRESRIFDGKLEGSVQVPRLSDMKPTSSPQIPEEPTPVSTEPVYEEPLQSATINNVSDIPYLPYLPPSPAQQTTPTFPRPRTAGAEKSFPTTRPPRRPTDPIRPPSTRKNSTTSLTVSSRPSSPFDKHLIPDHSSEGAQSRTSSPSTPPHQYTHSSKRGPVPNLNIHRPMMHRMTRKHSETSIHSLSSIRSEMDLTPAPSAFASSSQTALNSLEGRPVRKASQRRHARHASSASRSFMGLKLGKRAFNKV